MTSLWTPLDRPLASLRNTPPPEYVETFLSGMPETYRVQHSASEVTDHAGIAWRRRGEVAHLEQWAAGARDATWLCVVTDDRPGLLTLLSAAITAHSLNIVRAKIYCRDTPDHRLEAVDFFCVRSLKSDGVLRMDDAEIQGIRDTIVKLLQGETDVPTLERRSSPTSRPPGRPDTSIYFDGERNGTDLLVIETDDHPGLLTAITRVLSSLELSIQWSEVVTMAGRARDEFQLLDQHGQRLSPRRKQAVVADVSTTVTKLLLSGRE
ncbi:MAG TPA: hypothetical protein VHO25_18245 [Polyangiaceae bacterium]|nr:hypothetical protein [Polyangiaceae bacterium]